MDAKTKYSAFTGSFMSFQRPAEDSLDEAAELGNELHSGLHNTNPNHYLKSKQAQEFGLASQTL